MFRIQCRKSTLFHFQLHVCRQDTHTYFAVVTLHPTDATMAHTLISGFNLKISGNRKPLNWQMAYNSWFSRHTYMHAHAPQKGY